MLMVAIAAVLLCGCSEEETIIEKVQYQQQRFVKTLDCNENDPGCSRVVIEFPAIESAPGPTAADSIMKVVGSFIFDETSGSKNLDSLMNGFIEMVREFREDNRNSAMGLMWMETMVEIIGDTNGVISLRAEIEGYTGGAHGFSTTLFANRDSYTGREVILEDILIEEYEEPLTAAGEKVLRRQQGLGPEDNLEKAGFWFPEGNFYLNDNYAIIGRGLVFYYNAYEIAAYAHGPTEILIEYDDIGNLISEEGLFGDRRRAGLSD